MAQLVLPYPDFQPNTKIVSAQIDANNAAIAGLLNGGLGPDNVLFPFLSTGTLGTDKSGTATALAQGYNSRDMVLRGSGWDGAAAQDRDIILRQIITGAAAYRLAFIKKEGVVETELLAINQAGAIVGSLVPDANGARALGSAVARWDAFIDALDVTGASSLGAISAIGAIAANILPDANATRNLGAAATRWNAIYGASLDLSGAGAVGGNLTVTGKLLHTGLGARVYRSTAQNIPTGVFTALAFDSERFDTDAIHDPVTNNTRLTCNTAGTYIISGNIQFDSNANGSRGIAIRLTPFGQAATLIGYTNQPATGYVLGTQAIYGLAVGDYVELVVFQDSGVALNVVAAATFSPEFSMIKVG